MRCFRYLQHSNFHKYLNFFSRLVNTRLGMNMHTFIHTHSYILVHKMTGYLNVIFIIQRITIFTPLYLI